jgi:N-acetylglucosaminyl-diphospho-decaprenol L-rhamnosyltransferase
MAQVSVDALIVSFGTRDELRDCLATLLASPVPAGVELRASVLDNASQDGSADMVAREFPVVRLIRSPLNVGFGIATNRLAAASTASHLLLLNPDTRVEGPLVGPLLDALEADPAIAVAGPRLVFPDGEVQTSSERFPTLRFELARELRGTKLQRPLRRVLDADAVLRDHRRLDLVQARRPHDADFLWATCWLLRRADVPASGLFDPHFPVYDEDLDLCSRLRKQGRRLVYVPEAEVVHLGGASSTTAHKQQLVRAGRTRWYRRHRGPAAAAAYAAIARAASAAKGAAARARGDAG